ncbi:protein required for maturation of hydrogenases [Candidatus Desulfarcum epimagneticum]|uniref:Protein required for maturation of hydrogenases n=1 Tax=uncultured Desulfobacteraceae bacterium TaxID=218296 RepID=A0A484HG30_9BACT|nr:protein required for maturation of hydrogenases [uncultured Desulfobacteraceae bacterium]
MTIKHIEEYRDPEIARALIRNIENSGRKEIRLMEVCGTHTMSIFRSGIRSILPDRISLVSGPGCPVCVTAQNEIDAFIALAGEKDVIITTFGDLIRVPGTVSSLGHERAVGKDIRMVYSTFDALDIARKNPDKRVVFLGVGFETTAPTIAASIVMARESGVDNYSVFSAHKLVPPALSALMGLEVRIHGFILPGHVSVVIGAGAYEDFFRQNPIPCVIAGFEPVDILNAVSLLAGQIESKEPELTNAYPRGVSREGNPKAMSLCREVFETVDANWRGIGVIPKSGFKIRDDFSGFDAEKIFRLPAIESKEPKGCACGEILIGAKIPPECPLYKKTCSPMRPVGPCMVSTEGTCAAYYKYHGK